MTCEYTTEDMTPDESPWAFSLPTQDTRATACTNEATHTLTYNDAMNPEPLQRAYVCSHHVAAKQALLTQWGYRVMISEGVPVETE